MTTAALFIFISACFALNLSPGPDNLFAMTTATRHGASTAFFPQFVDASELVASQFMVLGSMFLILEWIAVLIYALADSLLGSWLQSSKRQVIY